MNDPGSIIPPNSDYRTARPGLFGTKIPSSVCFGVGLLLFLLPFAEMKCTPQSEKMDSFLQMANIKLTATNTGIGLALGSDWKLDSPSSGSIVNEERRTSWTQTVREQDANTYAIIALALAVLGFGLSLANNRSVVVINIFTGVLAAGALIGLMADLRNKLDDSMKKIKNTADELYVGKYTDEASLTFTPWYFIALIALLTAAFFSYKRMQSMKPFERR